MAASGIGERLRNARQALGLSLDEIESVTRIRRPYLEALEQERFDSLPSPAYVRGFLRAYAACLGIPSQELLDKYPTSQAGTISHQESPVEVRITPATRLSPVRQLMIGAAVLLGLGVLALGVVLYGQIRQFAGTRPVQRAGPSQPPAVVRPGSPPARAPAPPASGPSVSPAPPKAPPVVGTAPPPTPPRPSPAPQAAPPGPGAAPTPSPPVQPPSGAPGSKGQAAPPGGAPPPGSPPPGSSAPAGAGPGKPAVPPAPPNPVATPGAGTTPAPRPAAPLRVVVVASGHSWVRTVADGTTVYEGFVNAGDKQVWEAKRSLTVKVGNASVVDVAVNGRSLGRLGAPGQVYEHTFSAGAPIP